MALSEAQIYDIATDWFVDGWAVARAIKMVEQVEYEVRKQDTELIRQLVEALEVATTPLAADRQEVLRAVTAARARLEGKP